MPGAAALTAGLLLIFTLGEATSAGWGAARTTGGLAGATVLLAGFVLIESRGASPMVPPGLFKLRMMRTANLSAVLVFGTFSSMFFFVSIFMQYGYGYSPMKAGFAYVPLAVCVAAGAGIASSMITKTAARPVLIAGLVITVAGLLLLWRAPASGSYLADLLPSFLLTGTGCGMALVTLQVAAFAGISGEQAGIGAGLITIRPDHVN